MILVDYSGISIANVFSMKLNVEEVALRHMILNTLRMFNVKYRDDYGQMVLAIDGGAAWRKEIFPYYKANRKKTRDGSGLDWAEFFRILNVIENEIEANLPFKMVRVRGVEADDIIATLVERTQDFGCNENVMIVSSDHDFIQLHRFSNVKQFSPMTRSLVRMANPVQSLREKILRGDGGDGVPNVLSGDDVFVSDRRQTPLSQKKVIEWTRNWDRLEQLMDSDTYKRFVRNRAMIDLSRIPQAQKDRIVAEYQRLNLHSNTLNYLIARRCTQLIECAEEFSPHTS